MLPAILLAKMAVKHPFWLGGLLQCAGWLSGNRFERLVILVRVIVIKGGDLGVVICWISPG